MASTRTDNGTVAHRGFAVTGDTGWTTGAQRCAPIQSLLVGRLTDGSTTRKGLGDHAAVYVQTESRLEPVCPWVQQQLAPPSEGVA